MYTAVSSATSATEGSRATAWYRLVRQHREVAAHQHNRYVDQQQPYEQARRTVPQRRSRRDVEYQRSKGQRYADQRCRVLKEDRRWRGV
jgi:hypothetical protein